MAKLTTALDTHLKPGHAGPSGETGVILTERPDLSLIQIAAWPDTLDQVGALAAQMAGCPAAPGPGQSATGPGAALLRIEPLKWWLVHDGDDTATPQVKPETGAVLDLSASRTAVQVDGTRATTLLNHFLPLDLRPAAFADGAVASTACHHVGVTLWRHGNSYTLFLPRSFAASLWEMLAETAAQYGLSTRATPSSPATGDSE